MGNFYIHIYIYIIKATPMQAVIYVTLLYHDVMARPFVGPVVHFAVKIVPYTQSRRGIYCNLLETECTPSSRFKLGRHARKVSLMQRLAYCHQKVQCCPTYAICQLFFLRDSHSSGQFSTPPPYGWFGSRPFSLPCVIKACNSNCRGCLLKAFVIEAGVLWGQDNGGGRKQRSFGVQLVLRCIHIESNVTVSIWGIT